MGLSTTPTPAVLEALGAAGLREDGLALELTAQLDPDTYRRVKKVIEVYGGKWNRKTGLHEFSEDFTPHLAQLLAGGKIGPKNPLAYYPTPEPLIDEMVKRIWPLDPAARLLEPSAGDGAIVDYLWRTQKKRMDCVEIDPGRQAALRLKGHPVVGADFLQFQTKWPYDYVLMNPPFTSPTDPLAYIAHIEHALTCLRPGGDLLAIVPQGYGYGSQKRVAALRMYGDLHEQSPMQALDPGAFKVSGTGIATCLIHITKPEEADMPATETPSKPSRKASKKAAIASEATALAELPDAPAFPVPAFQPAPLGLQAVPWNRILASALNPRKHFDGDALKELAVSIYRKGLQQNLVVRPHPEKPEHYEIAAGERRWRAIGLLTQGFEVGGHEWLEWPKDAPVNVLVQELSDLELLEVATAENVQRRRMTPMEEADAFAALVDHGSNADEIAAKFGYGRRTVVRRIQISKGLIPELRERFDEGVLTLAQVEVLAAAGPETQRTVWGNIRYNPRAKTVAELRKDVGMWSFLVKHRQFPPSWYTGGVAEADLFEDVEPYFLDPQQAMECQLRHARALADKDVQKGASFAEVAVSAQRWHYQHSGTGVVYSINKNTGELERWQDIGPRQPYYQGAKSEYVAGDPAASAQPGMTSPASPSGGPGAVHLPVRPAPPAVAAYPSGRVLADLESDRVGCAALADAAFRKAAYLLAKVGDEQILVRSPEVDAALTLIAHHSAGALEHVEGRLDLAPVVDDDPAVLQRCLTALAGIAHSVLDTVCAAYMAGEVLAYADHGDLGEALVSAAGPFVITEAYLQACNSLALAELWDDAGLGDRTDLSDETLRLGLLGEAPALAARGFLPRPMRRAHDVETALPDDLEARALAIVDGMTQEDIDAVMGEQGLDYTDWDSLDECRDAIRTQIRACETDELRRWAALWDSEHSALVPA